MRFFLSHVIFFPTPHPNHGNLQKCQNKNTCDKPNPHVMIKFRMRILEPACENLWFFEYYYLLHFIFTDARTPYVFYFSHLQNNSRMREIINACGKIYIFKTNPHAENKTRMRRSQTPHAVEKELDLDQNSCM